METRRGPAAALWGKWLSVGLLASLVVLFGGVAGDLPGPRALASIQAAASRDRFNLVVWELRNIIDLRPQRSGGDGDQAVEDYFRLVENLRATDAGIDRGIAIAGATDGRALADLLSERERIRAEMRSLEPAARREIQRMIGDTLLAEGLGTDFPLLGHRVFPPVNFTIADLPKVLVVSPRDEITVLKTVPIRPAIMETEIVGLEAALEARGLAALVEPIGGLATYPALVRPDTDYRTAVAIAAHEWVHHYLFFRPLGQRYNASGEMAAINETVANIVGNEIAAIALGEQPPHLIVPPLELPPRAPSPDPAAFNFNAFMRDTRVEAERLLDEGKVEDAERYMEERRQELVGRGYFIRKINQAYFAFYGTYTDGPAAGASPIYRQLVQVRLAEPSIGAFLRRLEGVTTPGELEALADRAAEELVSPSALLLTVTAAEAS